LGRKAKAVSPAAMADLRNREGWIHEPAGRLVAKIGPGVGPPLLEMAQAKEADHRARAAQVLGRIGPEARRAVPALLKLLNDKNTVVRQEAVTALANIDPKDKVVAAALTQAQKDNDVRVRRRVVRALSGVGEQAIPALEVALGDPDADVRRG